MDNFIGKRLEGRYEILELIGFGGMAVVYKARDIRENRFVAVKILKDEFLANEDFKRRFRNESKAIALLSHHNVVKILDVNFTDMIQYIVMEYIDGITLKEYIEQQHIIKWKEAVHFTVQVLRALQHAHDNGIVHRDVKPQNVMLLQDGTIKVMDFGIARFARESGKTMTDKAIGSVHYISPEQAKGDNTDEKTDIYAVGVMLYEMLTGKVPFDGDTPVSIALKQMQTDPPIPSTINPDIPLGLEEIILRAMQKDPQLRYQTAAEMLRDIDEFKHNPGVIFEYKYLDKDGSTKYFDKLDAHQGGEALYVTEPKKRSYMMNILAGVTVACVLLAIGALLIFFKGINRTTDDIALQNFIGKTISQAQKQQSDIKFNVVEERPSVDYEKGVIIEQKPDAGIRVKKNYEISVVVSTGITSTSMPDLKNEMTSAAKSRLNKMGITEITVAQMTDNSVPAGRVISTDPEAGSEIKKGDKVILYVSAGAADEPVRIPTLIGKTEIEARAAIAPLDIMIGKATYEPSTQAYGTIFWQSIDPETKVKKGSTVDIKMSNGEAVVSSEPPVSSEIITAEPVPEGTVISIVFPEGVDNKNFTFNVLCNSQDFDTIEINPAVNNKMVIDLKLDNGYINGLVKGERTNNFIITVNGSSFAQYRVNFETNSVSTTSKPDYSLLFTNGYTPTVGSATSQRPAPHQVTSEPTSSAMVRE